MKVDFENTPTFIVSKPDGEKEKRCIRYMKSFGIDAVPMYGFRSHNCGISTDYYHTREKEKAKCKTIVAGLSHFSVWSAIKWMVESKVTDHRTFLIVEDDVELCEGFKEKLMATIQNLPSDWQFVFVGHCCLDTKTLMVREGVAHTPDPPMCTHAYMVRKTAVKHLIATNELMYAPIDIQLKKRTLPTISHYSLVPPLATQNGQPSTING